MVSWVSLSVVVVESGTKSWNWDEKLLNGKLLSVPLMNGRMDVMCNLSGNLVFLFLDCGITE